ncbi:MAG: transporter substrate-binding domain-containing protein [Alphaproteobacteria bacterium]|nr:transporter substrate-binding domain-containing protein [Alphaproteobacteria bacterium]
MTAPAGAAEDTPPFRLCADPDNLPFSSQNEATPGFYVELGRAIAARLARPFEPVWVQTYFAKRALRTTLLAGKCDGFVGVPNDPELMGERLIFSRPIVSIGYALVAPKHSPMHSLSDLSGKRIAVQFGSPPQDLVATRGDMQAVTVLSPEEGMRDLADGKADAGFLWGPSAGWVNKTALHDAYTVTPVAGPRLQWTAAIAFARDRSALRDQVDGALAALSGTIDELTAKYGFPGPGSVQPAAETTAAPQPAANSAGTPAGVGDAAEIAVGHKLFNDNCSHCHGPDAIQGERRINLRLLRHKHGDEMDEVFITTVTHGRVTKGMPNWSGILTDDQFGNILAYLHSIQEP